MHTFLLLGAHAEWVDKHGITPEILARENGKTDITVTPQEWLANKDNDLRKMEEKLGSVSFGTDRKTGCTALDSLESLVGHVKQTIDYALSTLKAHSYSDCHSHTLADHEETTIAQRVGFAAVGRIHVLFYHRHGPKRQCIVKKALVTAHIHGPSPYTFLQFKAASLRRPILFCKADDTSRGQRTQV
jgi:hypothetical protein